MGDRLCDTRRKQVRQKINALIVCLIIVSARLSFSKDFTDDDIALTRSYKCDQDDQYDFKFDCSNSSTAVKISLSFIQMQAFQFSDPNT